MPNTEVVDQQKLAEELDFLLNPLEEAAGSLVSAKELLWNERLATLKSFEESPLGKQLVRYLQLQDRPAGLPGLFLPGGVGIQSSETPFFSCGEVDPEYLHDVCRLNDVDENKFDLVFTRRGFYIRHGFIDNDRRFSSKELLKAPALSRFHPLTSWNGMNMLMHIVDFDKFQMRLVEHAADILRSAP